MKIRTRIQYRIEINDDFDDDGTYRSFRSFRAAMNHLVKLNDPFATLSRVARRSGPPRNELYCDQPLARWALDEKGKVARFDRGWIHRCRKGNRALRQSKRIRLTHHGEPYTIPPKPPEPIRPDEIPF